MYRRQQKINRVHRYLCYAMYRNKTTTSTTCYYMKVLMQKYMKVFFKQNRNDDYGIKMYGKISF